MNISTSSVIDPDKLREADDKFIMAVLDSMKIPHKTWGVGKSAKTLADFLANWRLGKIDWDPATASNILGINIAVITVVWEINTSKRELREKYREFKDGRIIQPLDLPGSLAETFRYSENSRLAALRGLGEKLGQTKPSFKDASKFELTPLMPNRLEPVPSLDYPGFDVQSTHWPLKCRINEYLYEEEFACQEPDKTTYWHWVDAPVKPSE